MATAHLLELCASRHLLRPQRRLDALEQSLEPSDQLGLGNSKLRFRWRFSLEGHEDRIEFLLEVIREDISEFVMEDARQKVEGTTDRGVLLRVSRVVPEEGTTMEFPVRSTPLKDYLDGNPMMQTWYPRLLGTAAKSVWGSGHDSWKGATQIERWVFEHV